ncbi:MAG TPA: alpha/beta hydrolase [Pirellulales bacterium]
MRFLPVALLLVAVCPSLLAAQAADAPPTAGPAAIVRLDKSVADAPQAGRLYVFLSARGEEAPIEGPNWFRPEPFFGLEVVDFVPGETKRIDDSADGFPDKFSKLPAGSYRVQAILDQKFDEQHPAAAAGNRYSSIVEWTHDPAALKNVELTLDKKVEPRVFKEGKFAKEVAPISGRLSKFFGREVRHRAAVVLPSSYYDQPEKRYPVLFTVPGFSGTHYGAEAYGEKGIAAGEGEVEMIRVMLSGQCAWGHHVYADSATNGPRGESFITELIPFLDAEYRTIPEPSARFLTGHSSGGWSSLWLQTTYPEVFGGVWSTSPDPVDFRDFQQVNLYAEPPLSLYTNEQGEKRPLARANGVVMLWYADFAKMDDVLAQGGQLRSFEAVFSPLDDRGQPKRLWDRRTGKIDPQVAKTWEKYDINLNLKRNWATLGPKLAGKLHIVMGDRDTFYLEGAVFKLQETLKELGSDAQITIIPNGDHGLPQPIQAKIRKEIAESFRKSHPGQ